MLVEVLVMPEGVVIVLDLVIEPELLLMVDDLDMPAGLVIVLDLVVVVAGVWDVVLIFDELVLILLVDAAGGVAGVAGVAAGVWARAAEPPSKLRETRKLRMRFIKRAKKEGERCASYGASGAVVGCQCNKYSKLTQPSRTLNHASHPCQLLPILCLAFFRRPSIS
ncbi:MAG: hypothetical protein NVS3B25_12930 [Hymenobacter sp.]